jgi:hypothetical protein
VDRRPHHPWDLERDVRTATAIGSHRVCPLQIPGSSTHRFISCQFLVRPASPTLRFMRLPTRWAAVTSCCVTSCVVRGKWIRNAWKLHNEKFC